MAAWVWVAKGDALGVRDEKLLGPDLVVTLHQLAAKPPHIQVAASTPAAGSQPSGGSHVDSPLASLYQ